MSTTQTEGPAMKLSDKALDQRAPSSDLVERLRPIRGFLALFVADAEPPCLTLDVDHNDFANAYDEASKAVAAIVARIAELEGALRPFAEYLDTASFDLDNKGNPLPDDQGMGWVYLTVGDFRAARRALASIRGGDEPHLCPICTEPFKADDTCATDVELGICHAACLEGSPVVDLETGEPVDGAATTYRYGGDNA